MCSIFRCFTSDITEEEETDCIKRPSCLSDVREISQRRVLIGMDGSSNAEDAFHWYLKDIFKHGDTVIIGFCPDLTFGLGEKINNLCGDTEGTTTTVDKARERANTIHNSLQEMLDRAGLMGSVHMIVSANPGHALVKEAEQEGACMIVIGCRGHGLLRRTMLGTDKTDDDEEEEDDEEDDDGDDCGDG
ncbi:stress response protein nhaX [Elysia marginata]|uniref:Stress response protein nhaX n=1 Tax=Elysia marginata TaxID=1093978 RepID=A0AAV4ERY3_9GAST|nr:stress response protein nhaX [Elysia marginata]